LNSNPEENQFSKINLAIKDALLLLSTKNGSDKFTLTSKGEFVENIGINK
jgi:hypothetical protein